MSAPEILSTFTPNSHQLKREALLSRIEAGYDWVVARWCEYYAPILPDAQLLQSYDIHTWTDASPTTLNCQQFYSILQFVILDSLQLSEEMSTEQQQDIIQSYLDEVKAFLKLEESEYVHD